MTATSVSPTVFSSRFDTRADEISPTPSATDVATSTASTADGSNLIRLTVTAPIVAPGRASADDTVRIGAPGAPGWEGASDRRLRGAPDAPLRRCRERMGRSSFCAARYLPGVTGTPLLQSECCPTRLNTAEGDVVTTPGLPCRAIEQPPLTEHRLSLVCRPRGAVALVPEALRDSV